MIAYTYMGGYGLASGDPIGRPESIALVVDEFLAMCHERAWKLAFLSVRESDLAIYSSRGLHTFYLGDEAIVHCDRFDLDSPGGEERAPVGATGRAQLPVPARGRVGRAARARRAAQRDQRPVAGQGPERGFTMA